MHRRTYDAIAFRQQERSPIQVAFVAPARQILEWSGVPRKSDELLTGYQRFRDDQRIDREIVPFFSNSTNCSPTAAIVALRTDSVLGSWKLATEPSATGEIINTQLVVEFHDDKLVGNAVFEAALKFVNRRLGDTEGNIASSDSLQEEEEDDEEDSDEGEAEEIHLGTETLRKMQALLRDRSNWARADFRASIVDFVKPAALIDGQHRVTAAAKIGDDGLPFLVCGLYGAGWPEQVFHFTVVNLKPKRISPALITSIAALSLTREEQGLLKDRLRDAGIRMREIEVMSHVAYDEASPFAEKVNMAVGKENDRLLGYAEIKRIANVWHSCKQKLFVHLAKSLFASNNESAARTAWKKTAWFSMFSAFWNVVRAHFGDELWQKSPNNHLFVAANLWALQDAMLQTLNRFPKSTWEADETLSEEERAAWLEKKMREEVATLCNCFPREFWTSKWHKDYLSVATSTKRTDLSKRLDEFISEGTKSNIGYWKGWRSSAIIVGSQ